jgi:hypothetical protein
MILWNRHHGADSAVVPYELPVHALTLAVSVRRCMPLHLTDLVIDVPYR